MNLNDHLALGRSQRQRQRRKRWRLIYVRRRTSLRSMLRRPRWPGAPARSQAAVRSREFEPWAQRRTQKVSCRSTAPFIEICSTATSMERDRSISGLPAPIGPAFPCPEQSRYQTAFASFGDLLACRETVLDRHQARDLFVCRQ